MLPAADPRAAPRWAVRALLTAAALTAPVLAWLTVCAWTAPSIGQWLGLGLLALPFLFVHQQRQPDALAQVLALQATVLVARAVFIPTNATSPLEMALWSLLRDGVIWLPAVVACRWAGRWPWLGTAAVAAMITLLLSTIVSAIVVRVLDRPLNLQLLAAATDTPGIAGLIVKGGSLGFTLLAAAGAMWFLLARRIAWSARFGRAAAGVAIAVLAIAVIHEPLRRRALVERIDIHLDATNSFNPFWLSVQQWRRYDKVEPLPWTAAERQTLAQWRGQPQASPLRAPYRELAGRYRGMNLLIMQMESLRAEALGSYDVKGEISDSPEFDRLCRRGVLFDGYVATGQYSGTALWSVMTGLPYTYPWYPLHRYQFDPQRTVEGWKLPDHRHEFICASDPRFDNMGAFFASLGWEYVQVPRQEPAGTWGTHDEIALPWATDHLAALAEPWVGYVFSWSNHWPFEFPGSDAGQPYRSGIRYSDHALGEALRRFAAKSPTVAARTVIIVIADHGTRLELSPPPATASISLQPAVNRIPLLVLLPDQRLAGARDPVLASHIDLQPLISDLFATEPLANGLGTSPLRERTRRWAVTGVSDSTPPGMILWQDDRCAFVSAGAVMPLSGDAGPIGHRQWWLHASGGAFDAGAIDLLNALRALHQQPDLRWSRPAPPAPQGAPGAPAR